MSDKRFRLSELLQNNLHDFNVSLLVAVTKFIAFTYSALLDNDKDSRSNDPLHTANHEHPSLLSIQENVCHVLYYESLAELTSLGIDKVRSYRSIC